MFGLFSTNIKRASVTQDAFTMIIYFSLGSDFLSDINLIVTNALKWLISWKDFFLLMYYKKTMFTFFISPFHCFFKFFNHEVLGILLHIQSFWVNWITFPSMLQDEKKNSLQFTVWNQQKRFYFRYQKSQKVLSLRQRLNSNSYINSALVYIF